MPEETKPTDSSEQPQPEVKEAPVEETQTQEDASAEQPEAEETQSSEISEQPDLVPSSARVQKPGPNKAGLTFAILLIVAGIAAGVYGLMFA